MTKNTLTRAACKKDLLSTQKALLVSDAILLLLMLVVFVPLICISIYLAGPILPVGIVFALCLAIAPAIFIYKLVHNVKTFLLIKHDGFSIVKDTVCRLSRGEIITKHTTADAIYFTDHGRYIPSQAAFDLTSPEDEYYLAVLHTKPKEAVLAFHSLMYECRELD